VDLPAALARPDAGVCIATSRLGEPLSTASLSSLVPRVAAEGATVAFGAPGRGLPEILDVSVGEDGDSHGGTATGGVDASDASGSTGDGTDADTDADADADPTADAGADGDTDVDPRIPDGDPGFDLWLNTIPNQGSETVRTEEAMFASLAPLRLTE
jgi:predicted SPOUT superfamily RNA methylase MTH1